MQDWTAAKTQTFLGGGEEGHRKGWNKTGADGGSVWIQSAKEREERCSLSCAHQVYICKRQGQDFPQPPRSCSLAQDQEHLEMATHKNDFFISGLLPWERLLPRRFPCARATALAVLWLLNLNSSPAGGPLLSTAVCKRAANGLKV